MNLINAFLVCGTICLLGEIILSYTKWTPGHITSLFVSLGALLSFLGIYQKIVAYAPVAASIPITSFGHQLYQAAIAGIHSNGAIGLFQNLLSTTSYGISLTVIASLVVTFVLKSKE